MTVRKEDNRQVSYEWLFIFPFKLKNKNNKPNNKLFAFTAE